MPPGDLVPIPHVYGDDPCGWIAALARSDDYHQGNPMTWSDTFHVDGSPRSGDPPEQQTSCDHCGRSIGASNWYYASATRRPGTLASVDSFRLSMMLAIQRREYVSRRSVEE